MDPTTLLAKPIQPIIWNRCWSSTLLGSTITLMYTLAIPGPVGTHKAKCHHAEEAIAAGRTRVLAEQDEAFLLTHTYWYNQTFVNANTILLVLLCDRYGGAVLGRPWATVIQLVKSDTSNLLGGQNNQVRYAAARNPTFKRNPFQIRSTISFSTFNPDDSSSAKAMRMTVLEANTMELNGSISAAEALGSRRIHRQPTLSKACASVLSWCSRNKQLLRLPSSAFQKWHIQHRLQWRSGVVHLVCHSWRVLKNNRPDPGY